MTKMKRKVKLMNKEMRPKQITKYAVTQKTLNMKYFMTRKKSKKLTKDKMPTYLLISLSTRNKFNAMEVQIKI